MAAGQGEAGSEEAEVKKSAYVRIERTGRATELTGQHIAMMPLRKNVPEPGDKSWTLTTCKKCGRECWYQGKNAETAKALCPSIKFLCTECALKEGTGR